MTDVDPKHAATIRRLAEARANDAGALLPILHAIQDELGFIPEDGVAIVADVLNLSRAEVHGVSLEPVYCLGNCVCSPAVMLDETVYGRVTPERLDEILSKP